MKTKRTSSIKFQNCYFLFKNDIFVILTFVFDSFVSSFAYVWMGSSAFPHRNRKRNDHFVTTRFVAAPDNDCFSYAPAQRTPSGCAIPISGARARGLALAKEEGVV
jgi:hypothetical protein